MVEGGFYPNMMVALGPYQSCGYSHQEVQQGPNRREPPFREGEGGFLHIGVPMVQGPLQGQSRKGSDQKTEGNASAYGCQPVFHGVEVQLKIRIKSVRFYSWGVGALSLPKTCIEMTEKDFLPGPYGVLPQEASVKWKAPSNIALVKYWGKTKGQIPANASISFTLDRSATTTSIGFSRRDSGEGFSFDLLFEGRPKEAFRPKVHTFLQRVETYLPYLGDYHLKIETSNSFPHSSGIASSASGMAALALGLMDMESRLVRDMNPGFFLRKASFLARLGSGSAARSIVGDLVLWGKHPGFPQSSDLYGIEYPFEVAPVFRGYRDTILLVHKGEKQVSSSLGHQLMQGHPYAKGRFEQAHDHLSLL